MTPRSPDAAADVTRWSRVRTDARERQRLASVVLWVRTRSYAFC